MAGPGDFVCVAGGKDLPGGTKAEATIYYAYGRDAGKPVYFLASQDAEQRGMDKAFKQFGEMLGIKSGDDKWGKIALANPKDNPLQLNSGDKLNVHFDKNGKLTECFIANEKQPDPDFNVDIRVSDKVPEPIKPRAAVSAPSLDMNSA